MSAIDAITAAALLDDLTAAPPRPESEPRRLGFDLLDLALDGGIRPTELLLLGGIPGSGKTVALLQWARTLARAGSNVVFASYEHTPVSMLSRLLLAEVGETAGLDLTEELRLGLRDLGAGTSVAELVRAHPGLGPVMDAVSDFGGRLAFVRASSDTTDPAELSALVEQAGPAGVLFVDYLQKVPWSAVPVVPSERIAAVVSGLKELATRHDIPVVAATSADRDGLVAPRLRLSHLSGGSALAHEADVIVLLNEKVRAVESVHVDFDRRSSGRFRRRVVFSIEKHRGGPAETDLEFEKDFGHYRFDPCGAFVVETLKEGAVRAG